MVHFTRDSQVVLGVSIRAQKINGRYDGRKDLLTQEAKRNQEEWQRSQKIRTELEEVVHPKASAVTLGQRPPDDEAEFMRMKTFWETFWERADGHLIASFRSKSFLRIGYQDDSYYLKYRNLRHRQYREPSPIWCSPKIGQGVKDKPYNFVL
jgi:hypothetical protein